MGRVIGIDLGTTNSACAFMDKSQFVIIPNARGNRVTPSIVAFSKKGEVLTGEAAKNQAIINSDRTIIGIKRKMGSTDAIRIDGKDYLPQVISAFLLRKLKEDCEKYFGESITDAVITVPAYFSDAQRQATVDAGKIAGLNVLRIINEPTAAALAYGLGNEESQRILVFDLGGGTFDVSILELENGVFEVISTRGNNSLGGMDFDNILKDVVVNQFKDKTTIDLSEDKLALQKLLEEVEKAKITLSEQLEVEINIPFITADETGPKHLQFVITRSEFEGLIEDYIKETIDLTNQALKDAGLTSKDLDKIILVGGSTRIPLVVKKIEEYTGKKVFRGINPDEVVAAGAAIQTSIIKGDLSGVVLADITPLSLGIEVEGDGFVPIIKRNTPIPTRETKIFTTTVVNQEEVEIHVLQGERKIASQNITLGKFILAGIRKANAGVPRIEVAFDIDVNSIVHVSAQDIDTGIAQEIVINSKVGFTKNEIDILIHDAQKYKKKDEEIIKFTLLKNEAKGLIIKLEKLKEEKKIDDNFNNEINDLIITTNKVIDDIDYEKIEKNIKSLKAFIDEISSNEKYDLNSTVTSNI
ncbi:MAG: molecular chaperone DnaK [Spirochaetes bacterium]|nr:molecular chaperone DnaK [Spirochaetota bacterium]